MAITVIGQSEGRERDAAEALAKRLAETFRATDSVTIVAGAKCYGEKKQDIDLLVVGLISTGFQIDHHLIDEEIQSKAVFLSNFVVNIEVKDHPQNAVRFSGNQVEVLYRNGWSNASDQAFQQMNSVRNYLERTIDESPWVNCAIWLRNVNGNVLPRTTHNIFGSDLSGVQFLRFLVCSNRSRLDWQVAHDRPYLSISACKFEDAREIREALDLFTRKIQPGRLDRRKLEMVCQRILKGQQYAEKLGQQLLVFRGRGGAGKTIRLLQIANTLHGDLGHRVLFLTYNKALVADVRRLLAILGISDKADERSIAVRSSDAYFFGLLSAFGLSPSNEDRDKFPPDYPDRKRDLVELLREFTPEELRNDRTAIEHPELFAWDYILIDEGQDWPEDERDILFAMFGSDRLVVADGVDQLVRSNETCDWTQGVSAIKRQIVPLKKSLRLKSNLCRFASAFAASAALDWDMEPNDDVAGGRVQIVLGRYTRVIHDEVMRGHREAGNQPIDALFCTCGVSSTRSNNFPRELESWGANVWDGTSREGRDRFPLDLNQHRIVNYESCRGLEGWTVVCLALDQFFDRQLYHGLDNERDLWTSPQEAAERFATRWCLIPFTRSIDTLVLQLDPASALATRILPLAAEYQDFVEIVWA